MCIYITICMYVKTLYIYIHLFIYSYLHVNIYIYILYLAAAALKSLLLVRGSRHGQTAAAKHCGMQSPAHGDHIITFLETRPHTSAVCCFLVCGPHTTIAGSSRPRMPAMSTLSLSSI